MEATGERGAERGTRPDAENDRGPKGEIRKEAREEFPKVGSHLLDRYMGE